MIFLPTANITVKKQILVELLNPTVTFLYHGKVTDVSSK